MIPTKLLLESVGTLLAADPDGLADPTTFLGIHLSKIAFTPGPELILGDLEAADFDGYATKHAANATPLVFFDPANGDQIVQVNAPVGGWHWETSGITNLPQNIFGWYCTDHTGAVLMGSELFPTPIVLNAADQGIDIQEVRIRISSLGIV